MAVGLSVTLARQSGTRCLMNLETLTVLLALNGSWKQFSLAATSVTSALEVIHNNMRYINLRFTLLYFTFCMSESEFLHCWYVIPIFIKSICKICGLLYVLLRVKSWLKVVAFFCISNNRIMQKLTIEMQLIQVLGTSFVPHTKQHQTDCKFNPLTPTVTIWVHL